MFLFRLLADTVILPGLACGLSFWLLSVFWERKEGRSGAAAGVALAVGYLTTQLRVVGFPPWPPVDTVQGLFLVVAFSAGVSLLYLAGQRWHILLVALTSAVLLAVTLRPMWTYHWEGNESLFWGGGLLVGVLLLWVSLDPPGARQVPGGLLYFFSWVSLAASVVLGLSASALLAQLAAGTAVSAAVLAGLSFRGPVPAPSWLPVGLVALVGLLLNGYFYARLTGGNVLCLALALPAGWLSHLSWLRSRPQVQRLALGFLAVLLLTLPPLVSAVRTFQQDPGYDYDYSGSEGRRLLSWSQEKGSRTGSSGLLGGRFPPRTAQNSGRRVATGVFLEVE